MQPWQLTFLGQHELPRGLTSFEFSYFFSFNDTERRVIRTRRRVLNQLGAALHLGFMKMSGCALDAFEGILVPPILRALIFVGSSIFRCVNIRSGYCPRQCNRNESEGKWEPFAKSRTAHAIHHLDSNFMIWQRKVDFPTTNSLIIKTTLSGTFSTFCTP